MSTGEIRVRRADAADDLATALEILTGAAQWEIDRGVPGPWPVPFPEERIRPAFDRGDLYLAEDAEGRAVGTTVLQWDDPKVWGPRPPDAGYIHRLATRRDRSGRGLGYAILRWAEGEIVRRQREWLRLDTLTVRTRLHRYYAEYGLVTVGTARVNDLDLTLFEKRVR